jgi:phage terminase large subunit GpA-like protein
MNDNQWLGAQVADVTDELLRLQVSEWAAEKRYLPPELTNKPGFWDNNYNPQLTEIMDCMSADSPIRKVALMKAAQVGATTGPLENFLGYVIDHNPGGMMYVSADKELTKMGVEVKVDRMIKSCGLADKIRSADVDSRKTGNTSSKKEFPGGFLLAVGAQNPGKLRSMSVKNILLDEVDGMPESLGKEGDPIKLAENRSKAFEATRKILYLSTPLVSQTSRILALYKRGDQRKYYVPCKHKDCGHMQPLVWKGKKEDGSEYGIVFETTDKGVLIEESVGYVCENCGGIWRNYDKAWFLPRGEWRPTAETQERGLRSYHIPGMLSPPGQFSWVGMVYDYLDAWDAVANRVKDIEKLKTFYNTGLGLPWEERGEAPKYEVIVSHRRLNYSRGEIPNEMALQETGSKVVLLTCAVDVHKYRLDVEVLAWCHHGRSYSVDWRHLECPEGTDTDDLDSPRSPWTALRDLIEREVFVADDGRKYQVQLTLIDSSYKTDTVYTFAKEYETGVYAIMGRDAPVKTARMREFDDYDNKMGARSFNINVTLYKDRLASWLKRDWYEGEVQPVGYPNYPQDYGDDYFREYEAETKQEKFNKNTKQRMGFYWVKVSESAPNHAWDCRVYNMAALDILIYNTCLLQFGIEAIDYAAFWEWAIAEKPYSY